MRTIVITIQTDDEDKDLIELEQDLAQEISCCVTLFDVNNMIVEEKTE